MNRPDFYRANARNRTGCHGISFTLRRIQRKHGPVTRRYYNVFAGGKNRSFRIDPADPREAFRRAVAYRAAFEKRLTNPPRKPLSQL
jgi:hypothetical protein